MRFSFAYQNPVIKTKSNLHFSQNIQKSVLNGF